MPLLSTIQYNTIQYKRREEIYTHSSFFFFFSLSFCLGCHFSLIFFSFAWLYYYYCWKLPLYWTNFVLAASILSLLLGACLFDSHPFPYCDSERLVHSTMFMLVDFSRPLLNCRPLSVSGWAGHSRSNVLPFLLNLLLIIKLDST